MSSALDLVKNNVKISTLPMIYNRLREAINNPRSSLKEIANIISEDQGLAARLLKLANSPFYGFPAKIEKINQAITLIGTQQLTELALGTTVMRLFKDIPKSLVDMESFWHHSIACGVLARILATYRREPNIERFFVSGIMHDIGRLIIYTKKPDTSRESLLHCKKSQELLYKVERKAMRFDHTDVGGALLEQWKIPISIVEMVTYHHNPLQAMRFPVDTAIVHVADIIANATQLGSSGERLVPPLDVKAWERIELPTSILSSTLDQFDRQFTEAIGIIQPEVKS
jgi:putative nucleotidyltransferase with HDIG domain